MVLGMIFDCVVIAASTTGIVVVVVVQTVSCCSDSHRSCRRERSGCE